MLLSSKVIIIQITIESMPENNLSHHLWECLINKFDGKAMK